jgi:methionyl-tRNA formyltransferase
LILHDIAMVASDTTRSKYYIEELIKSDLIPNYILVLINNESKKKPGQDTSKVEQGVIFLLDNANIQYTIAPNSDINSDAVVDIILNRGESVFIFSGFGGVLLKNNILDTGKFFLHVHGGYLPNYKGSTTNYYSLINENTIGATSIFLTKEIDCGPILLRKKFQAPDNRTEIDHIYDSKVRSEVLIETLKKYMISQTWDFELKNNYGGETFYIIHPVLKHLAILSK